MIPLGGTTVRYPAQRVASRQEEKERRRAERLAQEESERRAAGHRQRLQLGFGVGIGVLVGAGIALAVTGVFGGDSDSGANPSKPASQSDLPKLPQQQTADLTAAAKAAGCKVSNPPIEGRQHETKDFKASDYKTNPPTSGNHNPVWYEDGIYAPGDTPRLGMLVHPLEHGRIEVQYKPGTSSDDVTKLEAFLGETDGYHML